jgi:purine/pyrimidine-nucleoside phosphorylase
MLKVNEYFQGNVKSIGFENSQGRVTAGVMVAGDYEFGTSETERMQITLGHLEAKLPGSTSFATYKAGTEFKVAANVKFQVRVKEPTAYLCYYGEAQ